MRRRRLLGASGRPLNFTVRGYRLGWRELTWGQRIAGSCLLLGFIIASPFLVFVSPNTLAGHFLNGGLVCSGLAGVLDPQSYRMRYNAPRVAAMPGVCRVLFRVGVSLVVLGFVMRSVPMVKG